MLLPRAATCGDCFSNRCSWGAADGASGKNLAAHRRSNLRSRSSGILLITKAPGFGRPGLKHLNARGPIKVHPTSSALAVLDSRPIPPAPAAFPESCRSYPDHIGLRSSDAVGIPLPDSTFGLSPSSAHLRAKSSALSARKFGRLLDRSAGFDRGLEIVDIHLGHTVVQGVGPNLWKWTVHLDEKPSNLAKRLPVPPHRPA